MSDLETLTQGMLAEVKMQVLEEISEAQQQAELNLTAGIAQLEVKGKTEKERIDQALLQDYQLQLTSFKNQLRNQLLAEKQRIIATTFQQALEEMQGWQSQKLQYFVKGVVTSLNPQEPVVFILGERSAGLLTQEDLDGVVEAQSWLISLAAENIPKEAGFVLQMNGIEYNFCFSAIVNQQKERLTTIISRKLFD